MIESRTGYRWRSYRKMTETTITINSDAGVHARPAMVFVREAMKHQCEIFMIKDEMEANGKSIMSLLGLALAPGTKIIIRTDGEGEEEALKKLIGIVNNNFKELDN